MSERVSQRRKELTDWVPTHAPLVLVLLVVAAAFMRVLTEHWREGALLLGGSLLVAAVLRAVLPRVKVGVLAVRGRTVDTISYTGLGLTVIWLALTITPATIGR